MTPNLKHQSQPKLYEDKNIVKRSNSQNEFDFFNGSLLDDQFQIPQASLEPKFDETLAKDEASIYQLERSCSLPPPMHFRNEYLEQPILEMNFNHMLSSHWEQPDRMFIDHPRPTKPLVPPFCDKGND